jgi:hypothetical protein
MVPAGRGWIGHRRRSYEHEVVTKGVGDVMASAMANHSLDSPELAGHAASDPV